jgi:two-component system, NtrC family, response regulator AtoC
MPDVLRQEFLGVTAVLASRPMRELYDLVGRVASTNASVLVTGESGSGKELVARAIHQLSPRANKPWVDISCASLPEHLVESELFGYEKGAFSGALNPKPGLFELAHQGTIFLDEIGELEPRMQVKLLRVLDGSGYFRLGGTRKIASDVRVVAATNRPLQQEVASGRFREELFHRLSQFEIRVPPLRARREDIPVLAEYFLQGQGRTLPLTPEAVIKLQGHLWPGNVRELRNVITRAAVMCSGEMIESGDIDLPVNGTASHAGSPAGGAEFRLRETLSLDDLERQTIFEALQRTQGHHGQAASLLGISIRTLSRKLKSYEMDKQHVAQLA